MRRLIAFVLTSLLCAAVQAGELTVNFSDNKSALINPGMGFCEYAYAGRLWAYGSKNPAWDTLDWFPGCSTVYLRLLWSDLEPEEGVYRWDILDRYERPWAEAGKKIAIRVICCNQTKDACPDFVRKAGAKGHYFTYDRHGAGSDFPRCWEPEYDDPVFLEKFGNFLKAFAARYDGNPDVAFVDVGSLGLYGEGNGKSLSQLKNENPQAYDRLVRLHLDLWRRAMPNTYLVVSDDIGGADNTDADSPLLSYARSIGIGFRDDSIFCTKTKYWDHPHWARLSAPTMPVILETGHVASFDYKGYSAEAFTKENMLKCIEEHQASYFSIHDFPERHLSSYREIVDAMNLRLGYRIVLEKIVYPSSVSSDRPVTITSVWHNAGVAPCCRGGFLTWMLLDESGHICWSAVDESFNVKSLEPTLGGVEKPVTVKSRLTFGHTDKNLDSDVCLVWSRETGREPGDFYVMLTPGRYTLCFAIGSRTGKPEIAVPVTGLDSRRIYPVGKIEVISAN